jgi:hypothetical protein
MNTRSFSRSVAIACASAIVVGAAVALPAAADPASGIYGQLNVFGSDTTQDVMQGISVAVNASRSSEVLANYLAVGSPTVPISSSTSSSRANGSSAGRDYLRLAIGQVALATVKVGIDNTTPGINALGKIDVARSSSGPGSSAAANGVLAYVPFAKDALTMAVKAGSPLAVVPWYIGKGESTTTQPNLVAVYTGAVTHAYVSGSSGSYAYEGVGNSSTIPGSASPGTVAYALRPVVPQSGSGTRSYFIVDVLGLADNSTSMPIASIRSGQVDIGGVVRNVQEHDGTVMGLDETIIGPFSIGQFVAFENAVPGVTDRRNGAVLLPLKATAAGVGVVPFITAGGIKTANPAFTAAVRDVYNIVPSRLLDDPASLIHRVFYGQSSLVCAQSATIELYGFLPITNCGDETIRAYAPSADNTSTIAWTPPTNLRSGERVTVPVTVDSKIHGQGGTVTIRNGTTIVGTLVVPPHTSGATVQVSVPVTVTSGLTSVSLTAVFVPALAGITGAVTSATSVPLSADSTSFISAKSTSTIGRGMPIVGWISGADRGSVELWDGNTRLATYALDAGENGYGFNVVASKLSYSLNVRYVPSVGSNITQSRSANKTVTVARATPTVTATAATVTAPTRGRVAVTVATVGGIVPSGAVQVFRGTTRVGTGTLVAGRATVTLSAIARGTSSLTVRYLGDTRFAPANRSAVVFIVR